MAWVLVLLAAPPGAAAQDAEPSWTVGHDTLKVSGVGPFLLKPWLIKGTLQLRDAGRDEPIQASGVDWERGLVSFQGLVADTASWVLVARYQYIPLSVGTVRSAWSSQAGSPPDAGERGNVHVQASASRLVQSGSITRGVVAGSGRDASVESALKFELEGEIAPGVQVTASLTDEDTPILPQGTTRRLDQLDRVFIRIASRQGMVDMGDIEVRSDAGQFGRVRRNLQGVKFQTGSPRSLAQFGAVGAVSKGRFRFQQLDTADGVQGPYRLRGDQGEPFILVVPGSERVYLDGTLLERGELADYTMDYHTAEIMFTARHLIGRETRIRVEFEYSVNQFTRTFLLSDATVRLGSEGRLGTAGVTWIREADGSAFTQELAFTAADSLAVMEAGDERAVRSGARVVAYNPEAPYTQYVKETAADGTEQFRVLTSTPDPGTDVYRVIFSRVGPGNGNYERTGLAVNGVVYTYAGPGQGEYDPVVPLSAPTAQDLLVLRTTLDGIPGVRVSGEVATSRRDLNTLSSLDHEDDNGLAWRVDVHSRRMHMRSFWSSFRLESSRRSAHFASFARTRDVDFAYMWNLDPSDLLGNALVGVPEHLSSAEVMVGRGDSTRLAVGFDRLDLGAVFNGSSVFAELGSVESNRPEMAFRAEQTETHRVDQDLEGRWRRYSTRLGAPAEWRIRPFVTWKSEHLDTENARPMLSAAPDFLQYTGGLTARSGSWSGQVTTTIRDETRWIQGPSGAAVSSGSDARIWMVQTGTAYQGSRGQWTMDVGSRRTTVAGAEADHALLLGLSTNTRLNDRIRLLATYNARSERSAVLQEIFVRTGAERGEYVWDDFNGDGIIQVDEFLPETNPSEGEYVRALLPADSLEAVTSVQARVRLDREVGGGSLLRRMGLSSTIEVMENSRSADRRAIYTLQPSALRIPGETIQGRLRLVQRVSFFPAAHILGLDLLAQVVRSLNGLSTGSESRTASIVQASFRYRPVTHLEWGLRLAREVEASESSAFVTRSYDILGREVEPSLRYRWPEGWTVKAAPLLAWKREKRFKSTARVLQIPLEVVREWGPKARSTVRIEHARNNLDAARAGLVAWELTDGRGSGSSWLWRLGIQAELNESLTARLGYDGRKPSRGSTIHTGRFQLTAFF
ncbi:MAG: hypothetical protein RIE53_06940 [Rhodothermales bacterium]